MDLIPLNMTLAGVPVTVDQRAQKFADHFHQKVITNVNNVYINLLFYHVKWVWIIQALNKHWRSKALFCLLHFSVQDIDLTWIVRCPYLTELNWKDVGKVNKVLCSWLTNEIRDIRIAGWVITQQSFPIRIAIWYIQSKRSRLDIAQK